MSVTGGATASLLRQLNSAAVLDYLLDVDAATGSEVMAATGLSRPTVHAACDELLQLGWLIELEGRRPEGEGRPGRPARCYAFNADAGRVIGVDLGEWKVSVRIADLRGRSLSDAVVPFSSYQAHARERIRATRSGIRHVLRESQSEAASVLCLSVGVAASVHANGTIYPADDPGYLPGLADTDIPQAITRGYGWPVLVDNDANLAMIAERWRGTATDVDNAVLILAGERLGAGIIANGQLVRGAGGAAGELAFLEIVNGVGDTHGIGVITRMLAEQALIKPRRANLPATSPSLRSLTDQAHGKVTGELVTLAARQGDATAQRVLDQVAQRMARVLAVICGLLNPELIVIAGGVTEVVDLIHDQIVKDLPRFIRNPPRIQASQLGDAGVLIGAIQSALEHTKKHMHATLT